MINYLSKPFKWFFKLEAASGLVLLFAATIALIVSNSDFSYLYFETLNKYLFLGINNFGLKLSILHWINDALMAIFLLFLTLENKREFIQEELSNVYPAFNFRTLGRKKIFKKDGDLSIICGDVSGEHIFEYYASYKEQESKAKSIVYLISSSSNKVLLDTAIQLPL